MATKAIINFGIKNKNLFQGPALEIGSLIDPSYQQESPKSINPQIKEYIGIDIFQGDGVDHVINLCHDDQIPPEWKLQEGYFSTMHCHCVLEHVADIFSLTRNISSIIKPGGVVFISVPFVWKLHHIPIDMWRFTPQSIDYLFPLFEFTSDRCGYSTRKDDYYPLNELPELNLGSDLEKRNTLFGTTVRVLRKLKKDNGFLSHRDLFPEMNLMMIGIKKSEPNYTYFDPRFL